MTTDKDDGRPSAADMDAKRQESIAYEYLCHLEEAKVWMEACIKESLPPTTELEEGLRNAVALAKLAHFINPELVPQKRIFDRDESRYLARGLQFRHTDNINHWLKALNEVGLPKTFWPETTDIYDRKNMPRVIYCIHALSLYLFKLGKAPQIQDLYGKINFTEEELSAMRRELDKYGIQMPAFSKIGGILANEMPVDEAALHAAIIAINEAIDQQVPMETVGALQNPAAHLVNIMTDLGLNYQETLFDAKETKAEIARNKSLDPDSSYIPDVYDELLTQAELQGNINRVNTLYALDQLQEALDLRDENGVLTALRKPQLGLRNISDQNVIFYVAKLLQASDLKMNSDLENKQLTKDEVQLSVNAANVHSDNSRRRSQALESINHALEEENSSHTMHELQNPAAELPSVDSLAGGLYHAELSGMREEKEGDLDHEELATAVTVLNSLARINQTVDTGSGDLLLDALQSSEACLRNIDPGYTGKYLSVLKTVKANKMKAGCEFLNHLDVQKSINQINQQVVDENDRITAVKCINEAVANGDSLSTLAALQSPAAALSDLEDTQADHYQSLLARIQLEKAKEMNDPTAELWYEEIQNTIDLANTLESEAMELSVAVAAINIGVDNHDARNLLLCLQNKALGLHSVTSACDAAYLNKLTDLKQRKAEAGETGSGWMMNRIRDGFRAFFNVHTMKLAWERPEGVRKDYTLLTRDEVQSCVAEVTSAHDRQRIYQDHESLIVKLQARVRGCLARKCIRVRLSFFKKQLPAVIKIQAWWKMVKVRKQYQQRMDYLLQMEDRIIRLQSASRTYITRKKHLERLAYFKRNEEFVIKIQSFMRSTWAKQDYQALMHADQPPLSVVRRFVHLLDVGDCDYNEEIEVEKLRQQVVTEIRFNQRLETDLNQMDIKIGLLVKNRITLQDVICHHRTLKKYRESSGNLNMGLKALSKSSRERLEAYQHLFYLLQTNPVYLARLIFEMPQSRTTKFMESVILTLYNYASNPREEYLLLNLFKTALQEEILSYLFHHLHPDSDSSKVDMMSDIVTGNPLVVKMIVSFNRNARGQGSLREFLHPLVTSVVNDKDLLINTNPVEVYKQWVNQMESQSGKASGLPYEVSLEQALRHEEVQERIRKSVEQLQSVTETFLLAILDSINSIPYCMRYMAKVLRDALFAKFPGVPEKDVLKIVGNLIYYRYINSAIVAPDAFDIMEVGPSRALTNDQRRNLGSVAKILQFAASNKGFGGESSHLACLNKYIMDAHSRFKKYFAAVCDVEEPEVHYNIDQYTDVSRVTKPVIYISIGELIDTHKLLLEHQVRIAPDKNDILHELLDDLGEEPTAESLIGEGGGAEDTVATRTQLSKTEVSLTLTNKFEVLDEDNQSDIKALMLSTKRLVVEVIRCQQTGENLREVLVIPATSDEEGFHEVLVQRRDRVDQRANKRAKLVRQKSQVGDMRQPLSVMKNKINIALDELERSGVISRTDNYQSLINSIVQDMRKQRCYRQRRRQEMVGLRTAVKSLAAKRSFQEEQIEFYNQYVRTCLANLDSKRKSGKRGTLLRNSAKGKGTIKYSAARLHEKGVVLEIEDLPPNQFKNVLFEISATDAPGEFNVNAKFMGVNMDQVKLIFQDLLQLQYEGVAVMKMFDKARVNVNLLIFLINKKFYGK